MSAIEVTEHTHPDILTFLFLAAMVSFAVHTVCQQASAVATSESPRRESCPDRSARRRAMALAQMMNAGWPPPPRAASGIIN
jgi:hypothetical protein